MPPLKLTKSNIDKTLFTGKPVDYFDTELKGFGLRVGKESKTFFARKEVKGVPVRKTIGKLGAWTPDLAREEAKKLLRQMDQGIDPRAEEKALQAQSRTLSAALDDYLKYRRLKETTKKNYRFIRDLYLKTWLPRPILQITRADVLALHRQLTADAGEAAANQTMVVFGSVWNYAHAHLEDPPASPTRALTAAKAWHPSKRRKDRLRPDQFPQFAEGMKFLRHTMHDAVMLTWHTGMRSNEVERLLWKDVDLERRVFVVPDTKNGTDLCLPMSGSIHAMMVRRKAMDDGSPYVFKGQGKSGTVCLDTSVIHRIGFPDLTVHGLRRTFRSLCEALAVPAATVKVLMNHSLDTDITDSYLDLSTDQLRPWVEKISAEIERLVAIRQPSTD